MLFRSLALAMLLTLPVSGEVLIRRASGSEWRYQVDGSGAKDWPAHGFDDTKWAKGKCPIEYRPRAVAAEFKSLGPVQGKPVTARFRRTIEVADAMAGETPLTLTLSADAPATVYLNGTEVARFSPSADAGSAIPETRGRRGLRAPRNRASERRPARVAVERALLLKGRNTLAVEVRHAGGAGPVPVFDVSLRTGAAAPEGSAVMNEAAREATMAYYQNHYVPPGMKISDGYVDGGRRMVVGKNSAIISTREILVIDRTKDHVLRKHLEYARDPELQKLPVAERAKTLAQYVDKVLSPNGDRSAALYAVEAFTIEYANRPVLFGEMEDLCQSGVCRHRALLFKMLCDDAGLACGFVRGNYHRGITAGGHAWNKLCSTTARTHGRCMNRRPGFEFLPESDPAAKPYVSVKDEPIYPRTAAGSRAKS